MIRYSNGPIVDVLYTSDGTKGQMIANITSALTAAGWVALGSGLFQSATTPSGQKIQVDVIDTGGQCVHLRLRSPTVTVLGPINGATLFPLNNRVFRILANQYQVFHFFSGTVFTSDPCDICFGVPYLPPFMVNLPGINTLDPWCGWMACNGVGDVGYGSNSSNVSGFHGFFPRLASSIGHMWIWDTIGFYDASGGDIAYLIGQTARTGGGLPRNDRSGVWEDGSVSMYEPYIAWPSGHATSGNWSPVIRHGQLWDSVIYADELDTEVVITFDKKRWRNVTQAVNVGGTPIPHSILLLTD